MHLKDKIVLTFNKFYASLLKDLKTTNEDIRAVIKKNYKVLDKLSDVHMQYFKEQLGGEKDVLFLTKGDLSENTLNDRYIAKEVKIADVLSTIDNEVDAKVFWNYIYILSVLLLVQKSTDAVDDSTNDDTTAHAELFDKVLSILGTIQRGESAEDLLDDVMDDDIKELLTKVQDFRKNIKLESEVPPPIPPGPGEIPMPPPFPPGMQDSMICNLAKEISNEIDVSNIKVDKPEDVFKLMDFSASNNIVGDIIKKVSTKIHDKINNGELKQEDLFGEAMNMMNMMNMGGAGGMGGMAGLFNNPMMSEVMKAMKKVKAVPKQDAFKKGSARDRLRAKLEERKKKQSD